MAFTRAIVVAQRSATERFGPMAYSQVQPCYGAALNAVVRPTGGMELAFQETEANGEHVTLGASHATSPQSIAVPREVMP